MKYFFPIHLDGDNRGCEGIAKGTAILLGEPKENLIGLCSDIELDKRLGIDKYVTLQPYPSIPFYKRVIRKLCNLLHLPNPISFYYYDHFVSRFTTTDVLISTGGDMMCYDNNQVISTNNIAQKRGCRTILWGCSMGPENLTPEKEATLRKFSLIYARETLSYDFFKSLGLKNVICLPDPAFVLEPETCQLPECFQKNTVIGLNLSNYTVGAYNLDTPFGKEVEKLIDYIIQDTEYHILLIPHVMWENQDDRLLAQFIENKYKDHADRFSVLDSDNLNYLQIRHIISQCYMFIGGRTHAVVSAYATCVPAIALGYSIKSKGIANDLSMPDTLVIDTKHLANNAMLYAFTYIENNYQTIKDTLYSIMPEYRKKAFEIREVLKQL